MPNDAAITPETVDALRARLEELFPEAMELLREMVGINSFSENAEGVRRLAACTARAFAQLGFGAAHVPAKDPNHGDHLFLTRRGKTARTLVLVTHLDTVFPPEEEIRNGFRWMPEGGRIYGPGTSDIKGGTVMIWLVLRVLRDVCPEAFEAVTWVIAADACEEVLSDGFAEFARAFFEPEKTIAALVFEAGKDQGDAQACSVVVARKGRAMLRVSVEGRGGHAGNRHAESVNAIQQLALTVTRIAALTDHSRKLTVNVGVIQGGTVVNRVPHQAEALVELRVFDRTVYREAVGKILAMAGPGEVRSVADGTPAMVKVEMLRESPPWPLNAETERLREVWVSTGAELGLRVAEEHRGGLSDANYFSPMVPTLDGLGPSGGNDHASERDAATGKFPEYVVPGTFVPKGLLDACAILKLIRAAV